MELTIFMKQINKALTQPLVLINKKGQVYFKPIFFFKNIKKFYRFIILELF